MTQARESKDREKMKAAYKKFQAGLAKILDKEQMTKYRAATIKIREGAKGKKGKRFAEKRTEKRKSE